MLIVDDDLAMGETLAMCLNRGEFAATSRSSGLDALVLLESSDFDVVVTDLNMDDMTGLVLCERIAALRPGLPVIVTTGFGPAEARAAALRAGAYEFLSKPIDLEVLRRTIAQAVTSRIAAA